MKNKRPTTTVTTRINVREALDRADSPLTAEEERVLRMRHGVTARSEQPLGLKGQEHPEARAKRAMIEQMVLEAMQGGPKPAPTAAGRTSEDTKAHIIRRLRKE